MADIDIKSLITEAAKDPSFSELLTSQEQNLMNTFRSSPASIPSYREYAVNIAAKFIAWQVQRDTKLNALKRNVRSLEEQVASSRNDLDAVNKVAKLTSGATALAAYAEIFKTRSEAHGTNSLKARTQYYLSLLGLLAVVWSVFFLNIAEYDLITDFLANDVKFPFSVGVLALKAIALIFFFQISQFFRKNYNAEKHLEEVCQHRSDVLQTLHAVYIALDDKAERDRILSAGAMFAFEPGETGYITTKEGAGSPDGLFEGILSRIATR